MLIPRDPNSCSVLSDKKGTYGEQETDEVLAQA
jgi:hypothetical protein